MNVEVVLNDGTTDKFADHTASVNQDGSLWVCDADETIEAEYDAGDWVRLLVVPDFGEIASAAARSDGVGSAPSSLVAVPGQEP